MLRHPPCRPLAPVAWAALVTGLAACGGGQSTPAPAAAPAGSPAAAAPASELAVGYGPSPALPAPDTTHRVTRYATVVPWRDGEMPTAARGWEVRSFATGLQHPRWTYVLANGDVLVAEANRTVPSADSARDPARTLAAMRAGNRGPSADRVTLLRDTTGDGVADVRVALLTREQGMNRPFGMAHVGDRLYVASTDAVHRFPFVVGETRVSGVGERIADLPAGGYNNHWTRNLLLSPEGRTLYVTVGSGTNVDLERQDERDERRAAILAVDLPSRQVRVFARGLRNPNGLALEPTTGALWTAVNERDGLGNDLVPDYVTSVREGAHYGWPNVYWARHVDPRRVGLPGATPERTVAPDYGTGAHTATMDLEFVRGAGLPGGAAYGALVVQRGSWNRTPMAGYRVLFLPFANGRPSGAPTTFLDGWIADSTAGTVRGRPSSVSVTPDGAILVTDDAADRIWLVRRR